MLRSIALCLLVTVAAAVAAPPAPPQQLEVDDIIKKGQQTSALLTSGSGHVSWTTKLSLSGVNLEYSTVMAGKASKRVLQMTGAEKKEVFTIIEREGVWYVQDQDKKLGKYRPYEAPLTFPNAYAMMTAGDLRFVPKDAVATVQKVEGDRVLLRVEIPPQTKAQIQANLTAFRELLPQMGNQPGVEKLKEKISQLEQVLADGQTVIVDSKTGVLLRSGAMNMDCEVTAFSAKDKTLEKDLSVAADGWKDVTNDPTKTKDPNDLLMISNCPMADMSNAKQLQNAMITCLVDLSNNRVRRIPFRGPDCLAGSFSKDRKKVYLSGLGQGDTTLGVYEVDLSTGANRKIAPADLPSGQVMGPVPSPDENSLAVVVFPPSLMSQVCLIDLKTAKLTKLGSPLDTAHLSWTDDGKQIVLTSRKTIAMDKPSEDSVAKMGLDGQVSVMLRGHACFFVPGRNRIAFQQGEDWATCDMDGKNVEPYAGGMKGHAFPAVSADGKRMVWMRFENGKLPQPVIQEFGKPETKNLDLGPGLWASPIWR